MAKQKVEVWLEEDDLDIIATLSRNRSEWIRDAVGKKIENDLAEIEEDKKMRAMYEAQRGEGK